MPKPGPNFVAAATRDGEVDTQQLHELYTAATTQSQFSLRVLMRPGVWREAVFVRGHVWSNPKRGVLRADTEIMVVGKMPWTEETIHRANFVGPSGRYFQEKCKEFDLAWQDWYVTNVVHYMPPDGSSNLKAAYVSDCRPILHQELACLKPRIVVCLGKEAYKAVTRRTDSITASTGLAMPVQIVVGATADEQPILHEMVVVPILHPAEALRDPAKERIFLRGMEALREVVRGKPVTSSLPSEQAWTVARTRSEVEAWLRVMKERLNRLPLRDRFVGLDCEWHGKNPYRSDSYLRTIQLACCGQALVIVLTKPGGELTYDQPVSELMQALKKFLEQTRPVGHFLAFDAVWLAYFGLDVFAVNPVPLMPKDGVTPWHQVRDGVGYWDTAYAAHALEETSGFGALDLTSVALRYAQVPRYDMELQDWCKAHKAITANGYGEVPEELLVPYAARDVLVLEPICRAQSRQLDKDAYGNDVWQPFWESLLIQPVLAEMMSRGVFVDTQRLVALRQLFYERREALLRQMREWANWPDFNPRSTYHVRAYLFGDQYVSGYSPDGKPIRLYPENARVCQFSPVTTTRDGQLWVDLEDDFAMESATPATDKGVLEMLARQDTPYQQQVCWLRDYRFLDQALKTVLSEKAGRASLEWAVDCDGRVRTLLSATAETGRWKSSQPPLQNWSKDRDTDYERILGDDYKHCRLRSLLRADPGQPHDVMSWKEQPQHRWMVAQACPVYRRRIGVNRLLVEFDFVGAELHVMAVMSGDAQMIEHAERAGLPASGYDESGRKVPGGKFPHPDYYDLHSHMAVRAFKLDCPPLKKALEERGLVRYRNAAKIVVFAMCYGAEPEGIATQAERRGLKITAEEVKRVQEAYFHTYPKLEPFYREARERVTNPGWLCNAFGRYRRFPRQEADSAVLGEWMRQAMNFPVQSTVASLMNRGLAWLRYAIRVKELQNEICLLMQHHDAAQFECTTPYVVYLVEDLLPWAFRKQVPLYPTDLSGQRVSDRPSYLNLEIKVYRHWGEPLSAAECYSYGIPEHYGSAD